MKKIILACTAISLCSSPFLRADTLPPAEEDPPVSDFYEYEDSTEEELPPGKQVGRAANDSASEARKRRLRNWGLAVGVVAIGITTLVLVAKNHK